MNVQQTNFLTILKDALHPDKQLSSLATPDWSEILSISTKQNLLPFVYNSAAQYDTFAEYDEVHPDMFVKATSVMSHQIQRTEAFLDLYRAFIEAGELPIVLKGVVCRSLYKDGQDFRASGDEDLLVSKESYAGVVKILNRCGYATDEVPDEDLELVQEVTFKSSESPLEIEIHLNPFGSSNNMRTDMNKWFKEVFASEETVVTDGVRVRTLKPTDHLLFLIFHAFKHFISGGFGVRMMLDILLFTEKYFDRIDWEYINSGLESVNATGFYNDLIIIGNKYLGFTLPEKGTAISPDELLEDMLRMGTFGNTTSLDRVASSFTADAVQKGALSRNKSVQKQSKFRSMFRRLFPSWQSWTSRYPYLKDRPWMLPVEWVRRLARFLRGQTDISSMKETNESYEIAERRMELLRKYKAI